MGRINITVYADELERATGSLMQLAQNDDIDGATRIGLISAAIALTQLQTTLIDGDYEQFVTALVKTLGAAEQEEPTEGKEE